MFYNKIIALSNARSWLVYNVPKWPINMRYDLVLEMGRGHVVIKMNCILSSKYVNIDKFIVDSHLKATNDQEVQILSCFTSVDKLQFIYF